MFKRKPKEPPFGWMPLGEISLALLLHGLGAEDSLVAAKRLQEQFWDAPPTEKTWPVFAEAVLAEVRRARG